VDTRQAILAFSQSEKIKSGLIWISQSLELLQGLPPAERKGAERVLSILLRFVENELGPARNIVGGDSWEEIGNHIERAHNMIQSGVGHEAAIHLSRALSKVTNTSLKAMTALQERTLL